MLAKDVAESTTNKKMRKINLVSKPLCDFRADDTLYIEMYERGHYYSYLCEFIKLERGIVVARTIESPRFSKFPVGYFIKARPASCYLIGKQNAYARELTYWFKNTKEAAHA